MWNFQCHVVCVYAEILLLQKLWYQLGALFVGENDSVINYIINLSLDFVIDFVLEIF